MKVFCSFGLFPVLVVQSVRGTAAAVATVVAWCEGVGDGGGWGCVLVGGGAISFFVYFFVFIFEEV